MDKLFRTAYFHFILVTVTIGPLLFGFHLGELNAPSEVITCQKKSIRTSPDPTDPSSLPQCIPMTSLEFGLVQSIFTLGGLLGALMGGPFSSKRGRLLTMRLNTIPTIVGPLLASVAPSVAIMSLGRFLSGIGAGAALVVVPIYVAEISPAESKGFYGSFTQIMTNTGIFTAQLLGWFFSHDSMWRVILAVAALIGLIQAGCLFFVVESPRWLLEHGHSYNAREILQRLRASENDIDDEIKIWRRNSAAIPVSDIEQVGESSPLLSPVADASELSPSLLPAGAGSDNGKGTKAESKSKSNSNDMSFFEVFTDGHYRPAILAVIIVMTSQQLTGINSIMMYGVGLLSSLLSSSAALLNIFAALLSVICTVAFAPLSDHPRLGRKGCLLLSVAGMATSSILLGIGIRAEIKILSAVCVVLFVGSFALGLGPVPFMLASEMVDGRGVGATQSWSLAANWIATFVVAQFFPIVNEALGKGVVYFGFCAMGILFFALIWRFVPETRGKENMAQVWGGDGRVLDVNRQDAHHD